MKSTLYAYLLGFWEGLGSSGVGRTHASDQDWNEAYDRGMSLADWFTGREC